MRLAVLIFSFSLIISTSIAHAIAFLPAVSGVSGVIMRSAVGNFVKINSKRALAGAVMAGGFELAGKGVNIAKDYCKKHSQKCKDAIGDASEYFWDKEQPTDDTDSKYYGNPDGCWSFRYPADAIKRDLKTISHWICKNYDMGGFLKLDEFSDRQYSLYCTGGWGSGQSYATIVCNGTNNTEKEAKEKEQTQKVIQNLSNTDIDIIINNYGDQIDIDKYCATNSCDELSSEFAQEVKKNKHNYDIDKITPANCEVKYGKIVSCDKAKKQLELDLEGGDEDNQKDGGKKDGDKEDNDTTVTVNQDKDKADDDKPIDCTATAFHKKVCDFIDWYQSDDHEDQDTKIDIKDDVPTPHSTKVDFSGACPANYELNFKIDFGSIGSHDVNLVLLNTRKLCGFLDDWVEPIVKFLGPIHAIYIIGRKNEV